MALVLERGYLLTPSSNHFYKIKLSYKGLNYLGWQRQSSHENTVQGLLEKSINIVSKGSLVKSIGSGRTDTGVHALGQAVRLEMKAAFPLNMFLKGVNNELPNDIRILEAQECDSNFNPVFGAKRKTYKYILGSLPDRPFLEGLYYYYPKKIDVGLINRGASLLVGRHDFCNYFCVGTDVATTEREIFSCVFRKVNYMDLGFNQVYGEFYELEIVGEGFLKQMVRLIVGALISLSEGRVTLDDIKRSISTPLEQKLGSTAPSCGLYLVSVDY